MPVIESVYQGVSIRIVSFAMKIIHFFCVILVLFPPVTAAAEAELPSELAAAINERQGSGLAIEMSTYG